MWRREASVDFLTPAEANLSGLPDLGVLDLAAAENRILVSHDVRTIPSPLAEFLASNKSAGVLRLSQRMNIGEAITSLIRIWEESTAEEWQNRIVWLPL